MVVKLHCKLGDFLRILTFWPFSLPWESPWPPLIPLKIVCVGWADKWRSGCFQITQDSRTSQGQITWSAFSPLTGCTQSAWNRSFIYLTLLLALLFSCSTGFGLPSWQNPMCPLATLASDHRVLHREWYIFLFTPALQLPPFLPFRQIGRGEPGRFQTNLVKEQSDYIWKLNRQVHFFFWRGRGKLGKEFSSPWQRLGDMGSLQIFFADQR